MMWFQWLTYFAVAVGVLAVIAKLIRYATAPESMRWELYPVPHEKGRADYGGSYLEELDWWSKPRHKDTVRELTEMAKEIILLKGVLHHNRKVWTFSFPFHFGLYLLIGWLFLLLLGAILEVAGVPVSASAAGIGVVIHYLTAVCGYAGFVLVGFGALGLLIWRLTDAKQRPYNSFAEYFNLFLFVVTAVVTLVAQIGSDPGFALTRGYVESLITLSGAGITSGWIIAEIALVSFLILYIPISRMSHFVAKYFLYHSVRWNDEPSERGSKLEKSIMKMLEKKVGWSAPHMHGDKTWAEAVTTTEKKNDE